VTAITGQPAYQQIAADLRGQIADGRLTVGDPLPSTANLMKEYGVSITAVRAAIKLLQAEGVLMGQPGKGVFVHTVPAPAPPSVAEVVEQLNELRKTVQRLDQRLSSLEKKRRGT
jgi:DNA-binding GntR family transcriptional regulator